jgi:hypothetical protein
MSLQSRKLRMEQMEGRQLMAVTPVGAIETSGVLADWQPPTDVSAYVQNGNLYVNESSTALNSDNGIRLAQLGNGLIRVEGTLANNNTGLASAINGFAYQDFVVTGSVYVKTGGGNDLVQIGFGDGTGALRAFELHINTGAPEMVIAARSIQDISAKTTTGILNVPDADNVMFWAANMRGSVAINTGSDHDWVFVASKVTIGDGLGVDNLTINTGSGPDAADVKGAHIRGSLDIQTYSHVNENDADSVYFDAKFGQSTIVAGNVSVRMGGGNDGIYITDPNYPDGQSLWIGIEVGGSMSIDLGAGNDTAFLRNMHVAGNFSLNTGAGADTVDMRSTPIIHPDRTFPAYVGGTFTVQTFSVLTENDADTVSISQTGSMNHFNLLTGGGNDTVKVADFTSYHNFNVDAGAGDDTAELYRVMGVDDFFAILGEGNDALTIGDLYLGQGSAKVLGGNGFDRLTKLPGYYPLARLEQTGWEMINGRLEPIVNLPVAKAKTSSKKK